jgi:hypothetical protein
MENQVTQEKPKFPTEVVTLPSKGLLYPADSPLRSGTIEMKYMTAREEDILTNSNYIQQGIVLDKLLESLIVSKINFKDILIGDKNAILIASRILGYGQDYEFEVNGRTYQVDLTTLTDKELPTDVDYTKGNEFNFTLPASGTEITFKLLSHGDELAIEQELKGLKKINPNASPELSTRLKYMITSINGNREQKSIRDFIDNFLLAPDARAFREYYTKVQPDIELKFTPDDENYVGEGIAVPISLNFFWPDAGV